MKKTSLKKLVLKIEKISQLNVKHTKGGAHPPFTDGYPSKDTSAVACVC